MRSAASFPLALSIAISAPLATSTSGCASSQTFEQVVRGATAKRAASCDEVVVSKLNSWGFRADACGETTYYRCYYTGQSRACCYPVEDEDAARAFASLQRPGNHCEEY